ncbi:hypothetical protein ACN9MZ_12850 [Pseudoduganella sp. S-14]|uniref:hypothetical protein n=1 Tax=Pseudoduganella sp. S-14 TaxID=3404065 RepID=UPI003CEBA03B
MNQLRLIAACAGTLLIVSQPMLAKATAPPVEPRCFVPPAVKKLRGAPAELRPKWMREVLTEFDAAKCASEWLFEDGGSARNLPILIKILRTDDAVPVRVQAAHALGKVKFERKLVVDALKDNLVEERFAAVVLARIQSIDMQLGDNWYGN